MVQLTDTMLEVTNETSDFGLLVNNTIGEIEIHTTVNLLNVSSTCAIEFIGAVVNAIAILMVICCKKLRTTTNFFSIIVCCCFFIQCTFECPCKLIIYGLDIIPSQALCNTLTGFLTFSELMDLGAFNAVAVNRYILIVKGLPAHNDIFRARNIIIGLFSYGLIALIVALLPVVGFGSYGYQPEHFTCGLVVEQSSGFILLITLVIHLPSIFTTYICYFRLAAYFYRVRHNITKRQSVGSSEEKAKQLATQSKQKRMVLMLCLMCSFYFLCYVPDAMVNLLDPHGLATGKSYLLFYLISHSNIFIYPLMFIFMSQENRNVARLILTGKLSDIRSLR